MTGGFPTPGGADVWGAQLNATVKALTNGQDIPPASANAKDDEFDGSSSASWTNTPTAPTDWLIANNALNIRSNGNGTAFVGKYQSVPSMPFTVECKMRIANMRSTGSSVAGLILLPASPTGSSACCTLHVVAPVTTSTTQRNKWSAVNGGAFVSAATEAALTNTPAFPRYLRWIVTSATSLASYVSMDGVRWRTTETGFNPSFTPGVVGLFVSENGTADFDASFEYFRVS